MDGDKVALRPSASLGTGASASLGTAASASLGTSCQEFYGLRWRRRARGLLGYLALFWFIGAAATAQSPATATRSALTCTQMEEFLRTAKIGTRHDLSVGVTIPSRATLDDGTMQHDASIQYIDESKPRFQTLHGTELNFRDSWKFNVAGYELAKLLELNMVPPYVERTVAGKPASVSWWVNDAMMERDRFKKKLEPPDVETWNDEMYAVRIFHQLIYDTDPNFTNILITKDWRVWMIDFSRAFRLMKNLQNPKDLVRCDRRLLAKLRSLTLDMLQQKMGRWVTKSEMEAVIARRDLIVKFFEAEVAKKGENMVLYDLPRTGEPCGMGLQ
jgi:hypothetical protein